MELPPFKAAEGEREFRVEVDILSRLDHPNLVSLIGYCADGKHRFLVYEYMLNGNLEDHLNGWFQINSRTQFSRQMSLLKLLVNLQLYVRNWGSKNGLAYTAQSGTRSSQGTCLSPFKFVCWDSNCSPRFQVH